MRTDSPGILSVMLPEQALGVAVRLPKELLRKHAARVKGDKALIDASVSSAWVTTLRHDTCGIAPYKSEDGSDYSELLAVSVTLRDDATPAQLNRLQQLIHIAVPYPLLLAITEGENEHLSILPPSTAVDSLIRAQVQPGVPEFVRFVSWPQAPLPLHLLELFNRWTCAIQALALMQNKPAVCAELPFVPLASPQAAAELANTLRRLNQNWKTVSLELKKATNPQQRITLAKQRHQLAAQIQQLLQSNRIIP